MFDRSARSVGVWTSWAAYQVLWVKAAAWWACR